MAAAATAAKPRSTAKPKAKAKLAAVPDVPGTFEIPSRCKVSRVISKDQTRPILTHAFVRRRKDGGMWLMATDSYHAVAVKIEPEGNLVDGFVPAGALRLMERGQKAQQLSEYAWKVETPDGAVTFDIENRMRGSVAWPDLEKFNVWTPPEDVLFDGKNPVEFGVNPKFVASAGEAIGCGKYGGMRVVAYGPLRPIYVYPGTDKDRIGLVMPVRMNS